MKRFILSAMFLGTVSLFNIGCSDTAKVEKKETVSTPGGSTTTTQEVKVKSTGDNPPANSAGETGKTAAPK